MNFNALKNASLLQKYFLLCLTFSIVTALLIIGVARPKMVKIKSLRAEIITQKQNAEDMVKDEINTTRLSDKLDIIEPELEKFNQIFINRNRELEFITTLENTASQENINQKINFSLSADKSGQIYQMVPLELSAQGSYRQILAYLNALEALNYYININSLEFNTGAAVFTPASEDSKEKVVNLKIIANTYWQ